jgi:hypothetical protein
LLPPWPTRRLFGASLVPLGPSTSNV